MPIDWFAWTVLATQAAVEAVVGGATSDLAAKVPKGIAKAFSEGPLAESLRKAFGEAFTGFYKFVDEAFVFTYSSEERLKDLPMTDAFQKAIGQLPYRPFRRIDVRPLREAFLAIGIQGAEPADFDAAWQALGRRFERAVAQDEKLKSFVDLAYATRQEEREEKLLGLVEQLVDMQEADRKGTDHEPALRVYCEALYQRFRYADTRGLFMREKEQVGEGVELRYVFVETPLALLRREKRDRDESRSGLWTDQKDGLSGDRRETSKIGEVLDQDHVVVVLGPPGSGKSTLMRCLALTLCQSEGVGAIIETGLDPQTVPILLPLKEFASALRENSNLQLDRFLFSRFEQELPSLRELLTEGRALLLLDGLDEVFDESHRLWASEEVWRFTSLFPHAHFVLTSRPRGYEVAPLPGPVSRWLILPFDDGRIGQFFLGWFEALAREGGEAGADESPAKRATALTEEVLSRPRLREMAQNPLLCTLIILVHRSRSGHMPERRVVFYEAAVKTLTEAWERMKRAPHQERLEFPEPETLLRALAEVAWRAFHQLANREISGTDLRHWLREYLGREPEWKGEKGERAVRDFLKLVGERTGLLVDMGGDRYQFVHLSLHEWLVSYFLLDRLNETSRRHVFRRYLHAPEWEEALRLVVGGAPSAQADILVEDVLNASSPLEELLRRDLRFVCRCLGDHVPVRPEIRQRVVASAKAVLLGSDVSDMTGFLQDLAGVGMIRDWAESLRDRLRHRDGRVRSAVLEFFFSGEISETQWRTLVDALADEDWLVRKKILDIFSRRYEASDIVRDAVRAMLCDPDWRVRNAAIHYFTVIGAGEEETRNAVLRTLLAGLPAVYPVVEYFHRLGGSDPRTQSFFLIRLQDRDAAVRKAATLFFAGINVQDGAVLDAILQALGDESSEVRKVALEFFFVRGRDPAVRAKLGEALTTGHSRVQTSVIEVLSHVGGDKEIRDLVLRALESEHLAVRRAALMFFLRQGRMIDRSLQKFALARLADKDPELRRLALELISRPALQLSSEATDEVLLSRIGDDDLSTRRTLVYMLARRGLRSADRRRSLIRGVSQQDWRVRSSAVQILSRLDSAKTEVDAVLERLGDEQWQVRQDAVEFCNRMRVEDAGTKSTILRLLDDEYSPVRRAAAEFFRVLGAEDGEARVALLRRLGDDDPRVRNAAVEFFARSWRTERDRDLFLTTLKDENWKIRVGVVEIFLQAEVEDEQIREAVRIQLEDRDLGVRLLALRYFLRLGIPSSSAVKLFNVYEEVSTRTSSEDDLRFSEQIGRMAASDSDLLKQIRQRAGGIPHFDLVLALHSAALELDRLWRDVNPLRLPSL